MKVLAIRTGNRGQGEFVLTALHEAVDRKRVALDDVALVSCDAQGTAELHKTKGLFHRRRGIEESVLKHVAGELAPGEAMVVLRGADEMVDAVGARTRALTHGDLKTYEVGAGTLTEVTGTDAPVGLVDSEGLLVEASVDIPIQTSILVKAPMS
jgi:hypothetical protein